MSDLKIDLEGSGNAFIPGDVIRGRARWSFAESPRRAELRLFWYTSGKGSRDTEIISTKRFDHPQTSESRDFQFELPDQPFSFSGKLITLTWALELIVEPSSEVARQELVVAPDRSIIRLGV